MRKVYVACSSKEIGRAEQVMATIRGRGGEITFDWTPDVREHGSQAPDRETGERCARADLVGLAAADVVLVLDSPEYSYGRIGEHIAALALGKPVVVSGVPHGRIWETLERARVPTDEMAIRYVMEMPL